MQSIRTYTGDVYVCGTCAQPSYKDAEVGHQHFSEQWDGVSCPHFPLAGEALRIGWNEMSLRALKATYPDTYPAPAARP